MHESTDRKMYSWSVGWVLQLNGVDCAFIALGFLGDLVHEVTWIARIPFDLPLSKVYNGIRSEHLLSGVAWIAAGAQIQRTVF